MKACNMTCCYTRYDFLGRKDFDVVTVTSTLYYLFLVEASRVKEAAEGRQSLTLNATSKPAGVTHQRD